VTLERLRTTEDELRKRLTDVRSRLAAACAAVESGDAAKRELAAIQETKREGAYRDMTDERATALRARVDAATLGATQRVRLRADEARLLEKLELVRLDIARAGVRRNVLPVLDAAPTATPCSIPWEEMAGDGDARTCGHCKARVLSLAMLEPADAERLLATAGTGLLHRRADGTVLAGDCPAGASRRRLFTLVAVVGLAFVALVGVMVFFLPSREPVVPQRIDTNQFGGRGWSPPPLPAPERPQPVRLGTVQALEVFSSFSTIGGGSRAHTSLDRRGPSFEVRRECAAADARGMIDAKLVDAFVSTLEQHTPVPGPHSFCGMTDNVASINVYMNEQTFHVINCSYEWDANGAVLSEVPSAGDGGGGGRHQDINASYQALASALQAVPCPPFDPKHPPLRYR
jgi:hypothetical protein